MWSLIKIGWLTRDTRVTILRAVTEHEQTLDVFLWVYYGHECLPPFFPSVKKEYMALTVGQVRNP